MRTTAKWTAIIAATAAMALGLGSIPSASAAVSVPTAQAPASAAGSSMRLAAPSLSLQWLGSSWLRNASKPAPAGSNNQSCKPSADKPYPVILVHGLMLTGSTTWGTMSPSLAGQGYCVYSIDYGQTLVSGGAKVQTSAAQLRDSVNDVLAATGASKVLIVGHSLGGVVARYYIDNLGGASRVMGLVSLAAPHQGTAQLAFAGLSLALCPACLQVLVGSPLLYSMNTQAQVLKPGVRYTQIATELFDEFVIPAKNSFLPAVTGQSVNLWLNDGCGTAFADHIKLPHHQVTITLVSLALANQGLGQVPACGAKVNG